VVYTINEVAILTKKSPYAVRAAIKVGKIPCARGKIALLGRR
jgi:hypothetical protein